MILSTRKTRLRDNDDVFTKLKFMKNSMWNSNYIKERILIHNANINNLTHANSLKNKWNVITESYKNITRNY